MNTETVTRIEKQITQLKQDRAKAVDANDKAIELEESRPTGHVDIRTANVQRLTDKKNSVVSAFDQLIKSNEEKLALARTQKAVREADENAANETQAAKQKANALRAYLAAGGSVADFEEHYKGIVTARTVAKMREQRNALPIPRI